MDRSPAVLVVRSNITQEKQTEQAIAASQEALQRYRGLGHPGCRTSSLNCISRRCLLRSERHSFEVALLKAIYVIHKICLSVGLHA